MKQRILKQHVAEEFLIAPLCKVLVVDSDEPDLQYHSQILQAQGHQAFACPSYSLGGRLAGSDDFDLVVVCQGGPAFEGKIVIEKLRERNPAAPFVVLARSKEMVCYLEAMQLGAVDYLEKPVHPAEMRRVLRRSLQPALT
ncbi:MAG: response regulator [Terriglobia bacterium]